MKKIMHKVRTSRSFSFLLTLLLASLIVNAATRCWSAPAIIIGTLPSFVFLIAAVPFVREHSCKCISPCWRAMEASCGLPVDFNKKPCQVDQPLVTRLHCLWQIWRLKYMHNSKARCVLHKLQAFYPGNVTNVWLKTCRWQMLFWIFTLVYLI